MHPLIHSLTVWLASIAVFAFVVFIHEFGHFIVAKWNGVGVIEFAIGFGRRLWSRRIGETVYSIRMIPLGGFVRMIGDDPREQFSRTAPHSSADSVEDAKPTDAVDAEDQVLAMVDPALLSDPSRRFLSKGYLARCSVVIAGPLFNLVSAILVATLIFWMYGKVDFRDDARIGSVEDAEPAAVAGIKPNDLIKTINGVAISTWTELRDAVADSNGKPMQLVLERPAEGASASSQVEVTLTPKLEDEEMAQIRGEDGGKRFFRIGVRPEMIRIPVSGIGEALFAGTLSTLTLAQRVVGGVVLMVKGSVSAKNIHGPIFIFSETARSARAGFERLASFIVLLSVTLAIMNLLPIPILDGGHLLIFTLEKIKGSPLSVRFHERAQQVGLAFILLLTVFALGNDIFREILGG